MTKREELFMAIGDIDDALIMRSTAKVKQKKKSRIFQYGGMLAAAACVMLMINVFQGTGLHGDITLLPTESSSGSGDSSGYGPDHPSDYVPGDTDHLEEKVPEQAYGMSTELEWVDFNAGPVMPLTFAAENTHITADRELTYDFSGVDKAAKGYVPVKDSYVLNNTSVRDQTVTFYYPYVSDIKDLTLCTPEVTVNEKAVKTNVLNGDYMGTDSNGIMKMFSPYVSADDYDSMVQDVKPLELKLNEELLNRQVVVYEFTNIDQGEVPGEGPTYSARFKVANPEEVFAANMYDISHDGEYVTVSFVLEHVRATGETPAIYFLNGEPTEYTEQGYLYMNLTEENKSEEVTAEVNQYETTMKSALKDLVEDKLHTITEDGCNENAEVKELYYNRVAQMFSDMYQWSTDGVTTPEDDVFYAASISDILYMAFEYESLYLLTDTVTIPAGSSVTVTFDYQKRGTCQTYEPQEALRDNYCYDNMPNLGTNVSVNKQVTSIAEKGNIRIENQNYGFDLSAGVKSVVLEPDAERYYMIVKILK